MATPRNIIGPQLRKLRNLRGLSQQQFAAMLQRKGWDVSRGVLARIEGQVRWVADFELLFLADALGEPPETFLRGRRLSADAAKLVRDLQHGSE